MGHVTTETKIEVMLLQAKECQGLLVKLEEARKESPLQISGGAQP